MMLFERMMTPCTLLECETAKDGEGGQYTVWQRGEVFDAACVCDTSTSTRTADKDQPLDTYTITTTYNLAFGDVFMADENQKTFQVISSGCEGKTPPPATFVFNQYKAHEIELEGKVEEGLYVY